MYYADTSEGGGPALSYRPATTRTLWAGAFLLLWLGGGYPYAQSAEKAASAPGKPTGPPAQTDLSEVSAIEKFLYGVYDPDLDPLVKPADYFTPELTKIIKQH